jgi:DNA-binding response OmpR family regulator
MILIAEDNSVVANYLRAHLKLKGYDACIAEDGYEAWHNLEKNYKIIQLVVADVAMPNMSGITLVEKMRASSEMQNIPVIFASGVASADTVSKAGMLGKVHFLVKPLTMDVLLPKIRELVPLSVPVLRDKEQVKSEFHLDEGQYRKIAADFSRQIDEAIESVTMGLRNYTIFNELRALSLLQEGVDLLGALKFKTQLDKINRAEDVDVEHLLIELRALAEALHKV